MECKCNLEAGSVTAIAPAGDTAQGFKARLVFLATAVAPVVVE